ncbi:MAG: hypothetical protein KBA51_03915 [Kiritimatiellae bacterium]|nr:hypothetical protein [Kiritimatiellia bacterium]
MNCANYQKWALLEDSGELAIHRRRRLNTHRASCAECRAFAQAVADARAACAALPVPPVDRVTLSVLQDVGGHHHRRAAQHMARRSGWAWATAATILIGALAGVSVLLSHSENSASNAWAGAAVSEWAEWAAADPIDVSLDVFSEQMARSRDESSSAYWASSPAQSDDTEQLAQELLTLWEA